MTEFHPLAELFPMMTADEIRALAVDVKEHGLLERVTLYEGKVLDGRNRYTACARWRRNRFRRWVCSGDTPLSFVLSKNGSRRNLTTGQRAMIAARLVDEVYAAEAATRKAQALKKAADAVSANLRNGRSRGNQLPRPRHRSASRAVRSRPPGESGKRPRLRLSPRSNRAR